MASQLWTICMGGFEWLGNGDGDGDGELNVGFRTLPVPWKLGVAGCLRIGVGGSFLITSCNGWFQAGPGTGSWFYYFDVVRGIDLSAWKPQLFCIRVAANAFRSRRRVSDLTDGGIKVAFLDTLRSEMSGSAVGSDVDRERTVDVPFRGAFQAKKFGCIGQDASGVICLFVNEDCKEMWKVEARQYSVTSMQYHDSMIASGCLDDKARVRDSSNSNLLQELSSNAE
ncbi:hypothetical protein DSL72_001594 [Monilinia vaccinii-corymbosi]|uniref:Uncharacterized protein n=1 Tax=Monilinia vaccinii-corymbosi TaxID=61207 RepID=A0A8A3P2B6_9HELO|nr:hypothetical protein DSL72_001594 [Monilinia vaccinii-corymbosi]